MSIRVDSSSLIAGAVVVGDPGLGVLAEQVPSTGEHGAGYLYASLEFPADTGKEVRGLITTWPTLGTLTAYEDSSFEYDGPTDTFAFQMYVDGQPVGTPQTVTVTVGASATIEPATGHIVARGYAPTVQQGDAQAIAPQTGHVQARGYAPAIQQPVNVAPLAGHISARGYAPEISQSASIRPEAGHAVAHGYAPSISQPRTIAPQTGHAQANGHAPIVVQGLPIVIAPQAGRASARGYAPGVAQGGAVTVSPETGHVRWRGWAPEIYTMPIGGYPSSVTITVPAGRLVSASSGRTITLRPR